MKYSGFFCFFMLIKSGIYFYFERVDKLYSSGITEFSIICRELETEPWILSACRISFRLLVSTV